MDLPRSSIILKNLQVKSLDKAKKLARALEVIEEECGIHEVEITIDNVFICPWIDLDRMQGSEMEKLLVELFNKVR